MRFFTRCALRPAHARRNRATQSALTRGGFPQGARMESESIQALSACLAAGRARYEDATIPIPSSIETEPLRQWVLKLEAQPPESSRLSRLFKVSGLGAPVLCVAPAPLPCILYVRVRGCWGGHAPCPGPVLG